MAYILEHPDEFGRLERQSTLPSYDFQSELRSFAVDGAAKVLDAGCGSGIVSRYLAARFPNAQITGCDRSAALLDEARRNSAHIRNLQFSRQDLLDLKLPDGAFDAVVIRYVLHHQNAGNQRKIVSELCRVLRPGGQITVIDVDGVMLNLYPQTELVQESFGKLASSEEIDLYVGRKLPHLLTSQGFCSVRWKIDTVEFRDANKESEMQLMRERFTNGAEYFQRTIGTGNIWERFEKEYFDCFGAEQSVSFFNKFIVSGQKE